MSLPDVKSALDWLGQVAAAERAAVPLRLHEAQIGASDLLGAPRMSGAFYARLGSPYGTLPVGREVNCPAPHPLRRHGEPRCVMCEDTGYWMTTTAVYARPLAAALSSLSRTRSRLRPHPHRVVGALLAAGCDPARLDPAPDSRTVLSAIRALYDGFSYTAIPARRAA